MSKRRLISLLFIILFVSVGIGIFIREQKIKKILINRSLVVVVESNSYLGESDIQWYEENKKYIDLIIAALTPAKYSQLKELSLEVIMDNYVEDMIGNLIITGGRNYGKKILLTDANATTINIQKVLRENTENNYVSDLLIVSHGNDNLLYLNNEYVNVLKFGNVLKSQNYLIGYVYNTACYGSTHAQSWLDAGAMVSNGSKTTNSFSIFSPMFFEYLWTHGDTFEQAVKKSYVYEYRVWTIANFFIPGISGWLTSTTLSESEMLILGNKHLTF